MKKAHVIWLPWRLTKKKHNGNNLCITTDNKCKRHSYLCKEKGFIKYIKIFDRDLPTKDVMMAPEQDATICWSGVMPLLAKGAELWPFMLPSWNKNVQFEILQANTYNTLVLTILAISSLFYTPVVTECDVITFLQCYTITSGAVYSAVAYRTNREL